MEHFGEVRGSTGKDYKIVGYGSFFERYLLIFLIEIGVVKMKFNEVLIDVPEIPRKAIINVVDSMEMIKLWFDEREISYTASDLLKGAEMVLQNEIKLETNNLN